MKNEETKNQGIVKEIAVYCAHKDSMFIPDYTMCKGHTQYYINNSQGKNKKYIYQKYQKRMKGSMNKNHIHLK